MNEIICGDALTSLQGLPDGIVQTCVTSPPYYGLRDYGTAQWEGGSAECDHLQSSGGIRNKGRDRAASGGTFHDSPKIETSLCIPYRDTCAKCGATRIDQQIGLEDTPEAYIARLVEVFREVKRVLRDDGTCWINIGDSYAVGGTKQTGRNDETEIDLLRRFEQYGTGRPKAQTGNNIRSSAGATPGLKPKDLIGIPWMLAFALRSDGWYLRSDIIWSKPNCMPESVTDRPTKAHEYIFLLSKNERYYYDADAIRESHKQESIERTFHSWNGNRERGSSQSPQTLDFTKMCHPLGRNKRSVWTVSTQPFSGASLLADYVGHDGKPYIVSEDCPVHGQRRGSHTQKTGAYDVQQGHDDHRTPGMSSYHDQEQGHEYPSTLSLVTQDLEIGNADEHKPGNIHDHRNGDASGMAVPQIGHDTAHTQEIPAYNSGWQSQQYAEIAIEHSTESHKTGLAPVTNSAYMPSAQTASHIGDIEGSLWSSEPSFHMHENNTLQDDLNARPLAQTQSRSVNKSSYSWANGNMAKCTCQVVSIDHFATFPPKLIEPCILAGTSPQACEHCGAAWERVTSQTTSFEGGSGKAGRTAEEVNSRGKWAGKQYGTNLKLGPVVSVNTLSWQPTCTCDNTGSGSCVVLDPFCGAGTVPLVALKYQRQYIGIELNADYCKLIERRIHTTQPVLWEVGA